MLGQQPWQNGWIVFLDANGNKQVDAGEQVIRTQPPFNCTDTFVASTAAFSATTFNRMGYAPTEPAANDHHQPARLHQHSAWTRCLAITPSGTLRPRSSGRVRLHMLE